MDALDWIEQLLNQKGFVLVPITPKIAILSTRLSGTIHGDNVDHILVVTAHEEKAVLATCDKKLLEYGREKLISVYYPM